ncbi:STAS/SEC14 domain-containing protein [Pontibacter sp. JH31]|uniref:STAS/SEC14 domain-containing protein n=1 Tax=Pontibacter aquaedesilientis TaxID=2766980 RepID=A0ABR7XII8_9BACT|nr:STAS/SEC14 domain-containing protein [Pontibacter aquaedesilientis]MBD1398118.1 STAS/SEC14 domain-containing protein [Pontibacter aquaedesilientis]
MVIYKNGFLTLDYEPATDILSFEMPNVDDVVLPEMKRSLAIIVEHVRNYDVKRVLLDARQTNMSVDAESYADIIAEFYRNLMATRVQKVARLVTPDSKREKVVKTLLDNMTLSVEVQRFTEVSKALDWLKSDVLPITRPSSRPI